jgi:zinc and cadmium transporter
MTASLVAPARLMGAACAVGLGALTGAALPFLVKLTHRSHLLILGFAAGVMFGAATLHMLPEAVRAGGYQIFPYTVLGFLAILLLERFVPDHHEHDGHHHAHGEHPEPLGLPTFLALSLHTLTDGLALGVALEEGVRGVGVLFALVFHQIPASVSLVSILLAEGYGRARTVAMTVVFALMVPLGGLLYLALREHTDVHALAPRALAFSAGTFLHVALADLLPQVHRKAELRRPASVALLLGLAAMWALRLGGV